MAWLKTKENQGLFDQKEKVIVETKYEIKIDGHIMREEIVKRETEKMDEAKKIILEVTRKIDDCSYKFIHSVVVGDSCILEEETSMNPEQRGLFIDMWDDLSTKARELTTFNKFAGTIDGTDMIDEHKSDAYCAWFDDYQNSNN